MFFDIGANIGAWSLTNISCHKPEKIIAVEAVPEIYNELCGNVKGYSSIIPLNYAVSNQEGKEIVFYKAKSHTLSTTNIEWLTSQQSRFYGSGYEAIRCPTIQLDDMIRIYGVPQLIKIDVEGGEYEVISSLTRKVDLLCFEWASETNHITTKCLDYLHTLGCHDFFVQNRDAYAFRPDSSQYYSIDKAKSLLSAARPKVDWGMIWCK
jgi:FkbM family methyltransferase